MSFPVGSVITKKMQFKLDENSTKTKLNFYQDHRNRFYDTSIGVVNELLNEKTITALVESKSINGHTLNKNIIFSFNKENNNNFFELSYMYHEENIPTYLTYDSFYYRKNEFYAGGFKVGFENKKIYFSNQLNFQFSNYKYADNIVADDNVTWNDLSLDYLINDYFAAFFKSNYKMNNIDVSDNDSAMIDTLLSLENNVSNQHYYNMMSFGGVYKNNNHNLSFGLMLALTSNTNNDESYKPFLLYNFNFNNMNFYINQEYFTYSKIMPTFNYLVNYYEKSELGFRFKNNNIIQSVFFGLISDSSINYNYFSYSGEIEYKWIKCGYSIRIFDENVLFVNNSIQFNLAFYPVIKAENYDIYIKLYGNHLNFNRSYEIDFSNFALFNQINSNENFNVSTFDGEFGIIFKLFKIAFIKENIFKELYYYNADILIPNSSNYLINIEWIFND